MDPNFTLNYVNSKEKINEIKDILHTYTLLKKTADPNFTMNINTGEKVTDKLDNSLIKIKTDINRMIGELQNLN
tara:strand:+ start:4906 stop:5127 length:222 start_codon:yes stop_codon:yes gene_type:complete